MFFRRCKICLGQVCLKYSLRFLKKILCCDWVRTRVLFSWIRIMDRDPVIIHKRKKYLQKWRLSTTFIIITIITIIRSDPGKSSGSDWIQICNPGGTVCNWPILSWKCSGQTPRVDWTPLQVAAWAGPPAATPDQKWAGPPHQTLTRYD